MAAHSGVARGSVSCDYLVVHPQRARLLLVSLFHAAQSFFGFVNDGISLLNLTWLMKAVWSATAALALVDMVASSRMSKRLAPAT